MTLKSSITMGQFYAIVGAQNHDKQGYIKLYKAVDNDVENWVEVGNLDFGGNWVRVHD